MSATSIRRLPELNRGGALAAVGAGAAATEFRRISFLSKGDFLLLGTRSAKFMGMSDVTRILSAMEEGDPHAAEQLLPLVYNELRRLAAQKLAQESPGQTLQATALVHEVYLRLVDVEEPRDWNGRGHFFAAAAEAMRRILVEQARRKKRLKHGGGRVREPEKPDIACRELPEHVLAVNEALDKLAETNSLAAELVKLRYFAGFSNAEAASLLDISPRKANQVWAYARAWLREELADEDG